MRDHNEAVEQAKCQRRHGEEVHRRNHLSVVDQECRPPLLSAQVPWFPPHPALHGSLRDVEAEHLQLAMNARRTPRPVLGHHAEDEFAQFPVHTSSAGTRAMSRDPLPVQLEASAMPANYSLGLHQNQRSLPFGPKATQSCPEQLIRRKSDDADGARSKRQVVVAVQGFPTVDRDENRRIEQPIRTGGAA